jgi:hypothetical protein
MESLSGPSRHPTEILRANKGGGALVPKDRRRGYGAAKVDGKTNQQRVEQDTGTVR